MARKRRIGLSLPWEQRGSAFGRVLSGARWKAGLFLLGLVVLLSVLWRSADRRYRIELTRGSIATVHRAIGEFNADIGRCPRSMTELVHPPRSGRRYLRRAPKDGWGRDLHMQCPGHFDPDGSDVISAGPSGSLHIDDNVR